MDPQGAAGYYYRIRPKESFNRKQFLKSDLQPFIKGTDFENLDLLPAHFSFRNLDIALDGSGESVNELKRIFSCVKGEYDVLILDCPPNMTLLSENIIIVADMVLFIPIRSKGNSSLVQIRSFFLHKNQDILSLISAAIHHQAVSQGNALHHAASVADDGRAFLLLGRPFDSRGQKGQLAVGTDGAILRADDPD